ncbi:MULTISPECIES: phage portal protein [Gammaproteobacteria]|uniref:phage portal protein n=1 Tax=Gammaproteobacteria TaxID=1236 RepID=UPI00191315EE|nr:MULTISPECIES: phage portal protein [Gammaproteobacteria]MBK5299741.1 phage portal protein [Bacillus sp. TH86]MBK5319510.1 phage portal protein [Bacillus sp. TH59]MBK5334460.1 phage portal protein [Bacillus sp. TH57]MBK5308549.1 phage portal protein [Pseudomonas sp. TH71]MBK5314009.1 phage portal protein [Erwinia sp. TH79]
MARTYPTLTRNGFLLPSNIKASYEGAGEGRRSTGWDAPDNGINSINTPALRNLRSRSRAAVRNDPYAYNVIDKRVSNLIGTGITPRPKTDDEALRKLLQELWDDWVDESDADERTDFNGQQALIARTVETSGECFVRLRPRGLDEGLAVPLQIQALAPEFVPHDKYETTKNGNIIRAGIEFTPGGKRVAYWMYLSHPRDASSLNVGYNQLVRVPAAQVLHIFEPVEPGQLRGVPRLSPVLKRLRSLDNYDDAVLFRQEVANLFAGFISRPAPDSGLVPRDPVTGQPLSLDRDGFTPMVALEPGTMQELGPGEEVEFSKPPDAGNNYPDFMRQQLMAAAAGTGTPYEILTGDMREVNDRALRVVLNEFRRRLEQLQFSVYVHQLCRPVRAAWMDMAVLSGALVLEDYAQRRREYLRTRWVPQGWAYIQPVQDVQARRMEVQAGFASRSEMVLRTGYDAETVDAENAADNERAVRLGLNYNTHEAVEQLDEKEQP